MKRGGTLECVCAVAQLALERSPSSAAPRVQSVSASASATAKGKRGGGALSRTGAQNVEYPLPAFIMARASRPICRPVSCQSVRLKDMPVVMGNANFVVCVFRPLATPVLASDHQLYAGRPGTARPTTNERRSTRFRLLICTYDAPPWCVCVRVDELTKARKAPPLAFCFTAVAHAEGGEGRAARVQVGYLLLQRHPAHGIGYTGVDGDGGVTEPGATKGAADQAREGVDETWQHGAGVKTVGTHPDGCGTGR